MPISETVKLLEEDENLIHYIKRLVRRRLGNETFSFDKDWSKRVVDLTIDEVLAKLDVESIVSSYHRNLERKSRRTVEPPFSESESAVEQPQFSESEPILSKQPSRITRNSHSKVSAAPLEAKKKIVPPFQGSKVTDDDDIINMESIGSDDSTAQGSFEQHDDEISQTTPPRYLSHGFKDVSESSLQRQSELYDILNKMKHHETSFDASIVVMESVNDDPVLSSSIETLKGSQDDKVLIDSSSVYSSLNTDADSGVGSMPPSGSPIHVKTKTSTPVPVSETVEYVSTGMPPRKRPVVLQNPNTSESHAHVPSDAVALAHASLGPKPGLAHVVTSIASISPRKGSEDGRSSVGDAEYEADDSSGVSSTHSHLSDSTPDYFVSKTTTNNIDSPAGIIENSHLTTSYEVDFEETDGSKKVHFTPAMVSDVFYTRYKFEPDEVRELFYNNDDTILFSTEYEREYRTADLHNTTWYDWMHNKPDDDDPEIPSALQTHTRDDEYFSDATEEMHSWENNEDDDDGIEF
jgi:hypothetical protein